MKYIDILVGVPASGKSTYVNSVLEHDTKNFGEAKVKILSTDNLVMEMGKGLSYDAAWAEHIKEAEKIFWEKLLEYIQGDEEHIIIDRTNLSKKSRARIFNLINKANINLDDCTISAIVFGQELPVHEWHKRLASRPGKTIPPHILVSQLSSFEHPEYDEGFNAIIHCNK